MKRIVAAAVLAILLTPAAAAEITKPIRYTWMATSCTTWNCAAAALVMANGDKYVIVLPTGQEDRPWLILRRIEEGSIALPENEPFTCNVFDTVVDATSHYTAMDGCHGPLLLNTPDGRAVVASLLQCANQAPKQRPSR